MDKIEYEVVKSEFGGYIAEAKLYSEGGFIYRLSVGYTEPEGAEMAIVEILQDELGFGQPLVPKGRR